MVIVDSYVSLPESIQYEYTVGLFQGESTVTELLHTGHLWDLSGMLFFGGVSINKMCSTKNIIISTYINILLYNIYPIQYNQHILSLKIQ